MVLRSNLSSFPSPNASLFPALKSPDNPVRRMHACQYVFCVICIGLHISRDSAMAHTSFHKQSFQAAKFRRLLNYFIQRGGGAIAILPFPFHFGAAREINCSKQFISFVCNFGSLLNDQMLCVYNAVTMSSKTVGYGPVFNVGYDCNVQYPNMSSTVARTSVMFLYLFCD